nr:protein FATTY ACID EXPORT 3, chloroplastic [Ipomoea batatas]
MSITAELFAIGNPNPSLNRCLKQAPFTAHSYSPASLGFESALRFRHSRCYKAAFSLTPPLHPQGLASAPLCKTSLGRRSVLSFAASREEPSSKAEVEFEKNDLEKASDESQEAWKQTLESFKEQALKMQSISKEAYEVYSKKAMIVLEETSEKLKIQSEKAKHDLSVIAKEISEESKEYLATAAENSPEPVKDIVETFASSSDEFNDISKVLDFYLGIPYGAILSVGGFLSFMVTGSIPAIRFGVILGGALLAFSISSLRSWRKGESSSLALKGQSAIATILFLRQFRLLFQRPCIGNIFMSLVSGSMAAFFAYRIIRDRDQTKGSTLTEN